MTALAVIDHNGEVVQAVDTPRLLTALGVPDVREAPDEALGTADDALRTLQSITKEARAALSDELVDRRDLEVDGTWQAGPWKIVVPSATAGTTRYDPELTRDALVGLALRGKISVRAVEDACPDVTPPAPVPWSMLVLIVAALEGELDLGAEEYLCAQVAGLLASQPEPVYKPVASKLDLLCKRGGEVAEALEACKLPVEPPKRTAKITRVGAS